MVNYDRNKIFIHSLLFAIFNIYSAVTHAQNSEPGDVLDPSQLKWTIRLDEEAKWQDDSLFVYPPEPEYLSINIPTSGWDWLYDQPGEDVTLPATVEQYFWNRDNNPYGVCGNYVGVSWFSTKVQVPENFSGKRIVIWFESVRMRAEVFVNNQLVGYDFIYGTPFQFDITDKVLPGRENYIDVRITDANGNFNWKDSQVFHWGDYLNVPSHGFGGITGDVKIIATDKSYIADVFIKNKPQVNQVDAQVTVINEKDETLKGIVTLSLSEHKKRKVVYNFSYPLELAPADTTITNYTLAFEEAKLWSVESPNLYDLKVSWTGEGDSSILIKRFGFRWFEVRDVKGDRQFYLNNKRIVLRSAISWGFWPLNGVSPSDTLAQKQILIAKSLGLNMLNFHRQIGQTKVLNFADELGLLYFEEPGGNKYPANRYHPVDPLGKMQTEFYLKFRNERLARMVKRDRSHPSLIIYNLHNERGDEPEAIDSMEMKIAHDLDETRMITYNSSNGTNPVDRPDARFKLHMRPYDPNYYISGWWDEHHAGGPGVYHDNLYNNPESYARKARHSSEIIFWGEDGATGTPPRLQLIRDEILKLPEVYGWQSHDYLEWFNAYNDFLNKHHFTKAFSTVDDLTREMGNVSFYYQGRIIENIRINNTVDGYVVNGWESIKLENHSGIVDNYRNPKGDIEVLAKYNQPLYLAVKIRKKVLPIGDTAIIDFYIINEVDLSGKYNLVVEFYNKKNEKVFTFSEKVNITGGNTFGELLAKGVRFKIEHDGYSKVKARLLNSEKELANGEDEIYAVKLNPPVNLKYGMVADTTGLLRSFLEQNGITTLYDYDPNNPKGEWLMVGAHNPPAQWGAGISKLLEWVYNGNNLVIVDNAEKWAEFLENKEVLDFRGGQVLGKSWFGGNYFVRDNPYFAGLPVNCVFNWEYQCLATYNKNRYGLRIYNGEILVGCVSDHKQEVYAAFAEIQAGRGKIIITSLDLLSCIKNIDSSEEEIDEDGLNASINTYDTSVKNKSNIVGQKILINIFNEINK